MRAAPGDPLLHDFFASNDKFPTRHWGCRRLHRCWNSALRSAHRLVLAAQTEGCTRLNTVRGEHEFPEGAICMQGDVQQSCLCSSNVQASILAVARCIARYSCLDRGLHLDIPFMLRADFLGSLVNCSKRRCKSSLEMQAWNGPHAGKATCLGVASSSVREPNSLGASVAPGRVASPGS